MIDFEKVAMIMGDTAQLKVLVHMLNVKEDYMQGAATATNLSHGTVSRVATDLALAGVISIKRFGKQVRILTIVEDSTVVESIKNNFDLITEMVD
jgi:hypothetical protein